VSLAKNLGRPAAYATERPKEKEKENYLLPPKVLI
jgi:hypothetical protein